jgi:hypothetical protein
MKCDICPVQEEALFSTRVARQIPDVIALCAVIDDKICEERLWRKKVAGETNFYMVEVSRNMVVDAAEKGNYARFVNHSCEPNCELQKW